MRQLGPESRKLFKSAREDFEPNEKDRAGTNRALARRLGIAAGTLASAGTAASASVAPSVAAGGAPITSAVTSAATSVGTSAFLGVTKWIGAAILVSAVGVGGVSVYRSSRNPESAVPAVTEALSPPISSAKPPPPSVPVPVPAPLLAASTPAPIRNVALPSTTSQRPSAEVVTQQSAPVAPPPSSAPSASPRSPVSPVAEETRLLREADEALRAGDARRALALLDEHAQTFPNGVMSEERSAERVSALCKLGRDDDARNEARRFLSSTPDSPLANSVRASCGGLEQPRLR